MLFIYSNFLSHNLFFTNPGLFYAIAIIMAYGFGLIFNTGYINSPSWVGFSVLGALLGIVMIPFGVVWVERYSQGQRLAQDHFYGLYFAGFPATFKQQKHDAEMILWSYPHDPRARYAHAALMYETGRKAVAEADLLMILADKPAMTAFPSLEPYVRALLVDIEAKEGKRSDAEATAMPICHSWIADVRSRIDPLGVCP